MPRLTGKSISAAVNGAFRSARIFAAIRVIVVSLGDTESQGRKFFAALKSPGVTCHMSAGQCTHKKNPATKAG